MILHTLLVGTKWRTNSIQIYSYSRLNRVLAVPADFELMQRFCSAELKFQNDLIVKFDYIFDYIYNL